MLCLSTFKKIKIIQSIFSNHSGIKLKISNRRKTHKLWKLNSTLLKNQQFKEGLTREIIKYFEMSENKSTTYQNVWSTVKIVLKGKLELWIFFLSLQWICYNTASGLYFGVSATSMWDRRSLMRDQTHTPCTGR